MIEAYKETDFNAVRFEALASAKIEAWLDAVDEVIVELTKTWHLKVTQRWHFCIH